MSAERAFEDLARRAATAYRAAFGDDLVAVALFGSAARGAPRPHDVDLYVVTRRPVEILTDERVEQVRRDIIESPEQATVRFGGHWSAIAPLHHSVDELARHPWILLDISHEGLILHDPDGVLARELDAVRRRLRELGSRRINRPDGSWYWDLKPDWRPGEVIEI